MDPSERDRRVTALVHTALLASVGVYVVVLVFLRTELVPGAKRSPGAALFVMLAVLGVAQFTGASLVGRRLLKSPRAGAKERVRIYFLLRAAAAEAIAIYGLLLGFLGAPLPQIFALFAIGVAALLAASPSRPAWEEALRLAQSPGP